MDDRFEPRAEKIADQERKIQAGIDAKAGEGGGSKEEGAVQAGARRYPEPPFPEQHQRKPGDEAALAFNAAQTGVRVGSTATTGGLGNPVVSLIEDVLAFFTVIVAFLAPIVIPVALIVLAVIVFRLARRLRERRVARPA